jgi:hypothetical protein
MKLAMFSILVSMAPTVALAADILPPVSYQVDAGNVSSSVPGTVVTSLCNTNGCSNATVSAVYASDSPLLTANVSTTVGTSPTIYVYDQVQFYFEILSASPGVVPIDLSGSASSSTTGGSSAGELDMDILVNNRIIELACADYATGGCGSSHFSVTQQPIGSFATNTPYSVDFRIAGQMGGNFSSGTIMAQLDPVISIDPSAGTGYSLIFSADPSSVPEPATWALMLLGFGGIGRMMRGKRKSVAILS